MGDKWNLFTKGIVLCAVPDSPSDVYECVGTFIVKEDRAYSLQPWWLPSYWKIFSVDALRADLSQETISSDPQMERDIQTIQVV